ncbi:MAG: pilus assembly protein TadG-related protein [Planctomycetaceae bacterium]
MKSIQRPIRLRLAVQCFGDARRSGSVFVLSAMLLVLVFAFAAFSIDLGYLTLARTELQNSADAAVMAATIELGEGLGGAPALTAQGVETAAKQAAVATAAANSAGGVNAVYVDGARDVRLGKYQWDSNTNSWEKQWGVAPYNLVEVTLRRDQVASTNGDGPLGLFFAPLIGNKDANLVVTSTSAVLPGTGIRIEQGSSRNADILPIALDQQSWDALIAGAGTDTVRYDATTGAVTSGSDGVKEVNVYPTGSPNLPPGNRGTVDIQAVGANGKANNSTADLGNQIRYGVTPEDFHGAFGNELDFSNGPVILNGDTGMSNGIEDDLISIIGQTRLLPIFSQVSGNGNNANYTIVKMVGVRVMAVNLRGKPQNRYVKVQPATFISDIVVPGNVTVTTDSYFAPAGLIR